MVAIGAAVVGGSNRSLELGAELLRALAPAGDVVAHVHHPPGARHRGQEGVERRHAVRVRRRHGEPLGDVVERALADPPDPGLDGVERRQEEVSPAPGRMAAFGGMGVPGLALAAVPARRRRAEERIDRRALLGRRFRGHEMEIQRRGLARERVWGTVVW